MENNIQEDLDFLKKQDQVIIPNKYTLWLHNANYKNPEVCTDSEKKHCWAEIPVDEFTVKSEMSFVSLTQWFQTAIDYGNAPSYIYKTQNNAMPFQIRLIQPKMKYLSEIVDKENIQKRRYEERGLGDGRHPKVSNKTKIYIFACSNKNEDTKKPDVIYGIREEDLHEFRMSVEKTISNNTHFEYDIGLDIDEQRKTISETDRPIIAHGSGDFSRFRDAKVGDSVISAPYKKDVSNIEENSPNIC